MTTEENLDFVLNKLCEGQSLKGFTVGEEVERGILEARRDCYDRLVHAKVTKADGEYNSTSPYLPL